MSHGSRSRVQGNLSCVNLRVWVESCPSRASMEYPQDGAVPIEGVYLTCVFVP
jgi:hypothetical protein